jgi:hypothetical protein
MEPSRDKLNNTPALQNVIGCGSPVAQFGAMGAAMRNGQGPTVLEVSNREVVSAYFAIVKYYESKGEPAQAPPPLWVSDMQWSNAVRPCHH